MISLAAVTYVEKLFLLAQAWLRRPARGRLPGIYVPMYVCMYAAVTCLQVAGLCWPSRMSFGTQPWIYKQL
jgi:hypothetical protein